MTSTASCFGNCREQSRAYRPSVLEQLDQTTSLYDVSKRLIEDAMERLWQLLQTRDMRRTTTAS
jgi:hypothetical protein